MLLVVAVLGVQRYTHLLYSSIVPACMMPSRRWWSSRPPVTNPDLPGGAVCHLAAEWRPASQAAVVALVLSFSPKIVELPLEF